MVQVLLYSSIEWEPLLVQGFICIQLDDFYGNISELELYSISLFGH